MQVAVIGAGSYGTCLAKHAGDAGHEVALLCRTSEAADRIAAARENTRYLPGHRLGDSVTVTADIEAAVRGKRIVLGAVPSHTVREVFGRVAGLLDDDAIVVNAAKGLEQGTFKRIDQVFSDVLSAPVSARACFLSGPTFAKEIAAGQPSAIVLAGADSDAVELVQRELSTERLRIYSSVDVIGVQIGGALKNVVAIAAGISDGLGYGQNTRAALITRGLAEISRIGVELGSDPLTFAGLSGMGDLVLTCAGDMSRNRRVGLALGKGRSLDSIVTEMDQVAEGIKTTKVARNLAASLGVEAPIAECVHGILYDGRSPRDEMVRLMSRTLKPEVQ